MSKSDHTFRSANLTSAAVVGALTLAVLAACYAPPPGRVYVVRRPPPGRVEVIGVAPGPGFVFVRGYWRYDRDNYVWVSGRWAPVERRYHEWVPGHWAHDRHGWYWVEGRWR